MSHRNIVILGGWICKEYKRGEPTERAILREAIGLIQENPSKKGRETSIDLLQKYTVVATSLAPPARAGVVAFCQATKRLKSLPQDNF
jgi:hypothetical protein